MNPELQRNFWLELSPVRIIMMPLVLGLVFSAIWTTWGFGGEQAGQLSAVASVASVMYFFIVVIWGTWISARLVTSEIRERTWDAQRMSAIGPWSMVTGKLIGGTAYVWYGGLICLVPIVMNTMAKGNMDAVAGELSFRIGMGLFAHASAFLVSMLAVRRRAASSRLASFFAMVAGISAAGWVWSVWTYTANWPFDVQFTWFAIEFSAPLFMVISLLIFAGWAILGNRTLMRHELQIPTGPMVWIAFLLFSMVYYAGQADLFGIFGELAAATQEVSKTANAVIDLEGVSGDMLVVIRWLIATLVASLLTYMAILFAPKDWVQLRQARAQFFSGHILQALWNLPSWAYAAAATTVAALALITTIEPMSLDFAVGVTEELGGLGLPIDGRIDFRPSVIAGLMFMARDIGIVLWFNAAKRARRPDMAAFVTLWVLHSVVPSLLIGMSAIALLPFAAPWPIGGHGWMLPLWPAAEAGVIFFLVIGRRAMVRANARNT